MNIKINVISHNHKLKTIKLTDYQISKKISKVQYLYPFRSSQTLCSQPPTSFLTHPFVIQYNNIMSLKQFQIESKLGEGSYSSVYKVRRTTDGLEYAMKKVRLLNLNKKEKQNALNEVRILASIKHPNIIGYKEAFIDQLSDSLIIIMEFASEGDLHRKIASLIKNGKELAEHEVWHIFAQIVRGLKVLHSLNIQHRDLKSANIFLCKNGAVKIGDLNVSKISDGLCSTQTGTPYYASPEVWKDQPYDSKSDIWALGCIVYEMVSLKPPFRAEDMSGLYKKVIRGLYEKLPPQYSQDMSNTVRLMLQVIPQLRPDCDKLLQHIYLCQNDLLSKTQPINKEGENILLETIRVSKNMRMVSEKLPKPDYSMIQFEKIKKSESRNSCIKNPVLPTINKNEDPIKKKRYVSERKREKEVSIPSHQTRDKEKEEVKSGTMIELKQNPEAKKVSKKLKSSVSRPAFELPFITQDEPGTKPRPLKKKSVKSSQ